MNLEKNQFLENTLVGDPHLIKQTNSFIELMKRKHKDNWVGADVGACIGVLTNQYAKLMEHVYSFEPDPANYKTLESNFNGVTNVTPINLAVSDEINEISFLTKSQPSWGLQRCGLNKKYLDLEKWNDYEEFFPIKVSSTTLDEYFKDIFVDFIKLDVEGAEWDVFKGAQKLLEERNIIYQVEFHNDYDWHKRNFLYDLGYDIYDLDFNKWDKASEEKCYQAYVSKEAL